MFSTNGAVTVHQPASVNRVATIFRAAEYSQELDARRIEQAAQDEAKARHLDHQTQANVSAACRAVAKYKGSLKAIGQLLDERRAVAENDKLCEGERTIQLAAIDKTVGEHRFAMTTALRELLVEMNMEGDADGAVAKDIAKLEEAAGDRRKARFHDE